MKKLAVIGSGDLGKQITDKSNTIKDKKKEE
jgi:hypothetical protein